MKTLNKSCFIIRIILFHIVLFSQILQTKAQVKTPEKIAERFFIPALQMGYINHNSKNITAGLIIQTSLEYRTKKKILFRLNYDDFSGRLNLQTNSNQTYNARIPISELIGGLGYRHTIKRNNFFLVVESGVRFYENPVIENLNGNLNIEQKGTIIGTARYTFGYEYELFDNVFFNSEAFIGHFIKEKDFWSNAKPFYGVTIGISARLF